MSGVCTMPGTGNSNPYAGYTILSTSTSDTFNGGSAHQYVSSFNSGYAADWWHPIVDATEQTGPGAGAHLLQMNLTSSLPNGQGVRFFNPFFIYIPVSAKPAAWSTAQWDTEIARLRQHLMHGCDVPPNAVAGLLYTNYGIVLPANPSLVSQAATKDYVDVHAQQLSSSGVTSNANFFQAPGNLSSKWTSSANLQVITSLNVGDISTAGSGGDLAIFTGGGFSPDQCSQVTMTAAPQANNLFGLDVRMADLSNGYVVLIGPSSSNTQYLFFEYVAGTPTQIGTTTAASPVPAVGDTFQFCAIGTTLTVYRNGVSKKTATRTTFSSGFPGIDINNANPANSVRLGSWIGTSTGINVSQVATSGVYPTVLYSAAGTALPTCNSVLNGVQKTVSDATAPTFLGTYTSGGAVVSPVMCNGSAWITY